MQLQNEPWKHFWDRQSQLKSSLPVQESIQGYHDKTAVGISDSTHSSVSRLVQLELRLEEVIVIEVDIIGKSLSVIFKPATFNWYLVSAQGPTELAAPSLIEIHYQFWEIKINNF